MKAYFKSIFKSMKKNAVKLISVTVIIFLGIAFVAGLGTLSPTIKDSFRIELKKNNASDIIVKSKISSGFSSQEIEYFSSFDGVSSLEAMTILDLASMGLEINEKNSRIYMLNHFDLSTGKIELIDGRLPNTENGDLEICVERQSDTIEKMEIGQKISMFGVEATIVGVVSNSLIFDRSGELDIKNQKPLEFIAYALKPNLMASLPESFRNLIPNSTDIYIKLNGTSDYFKDSYNRKVDSKISSLKAGLSKEGFDKNNYEFLTLNQTKSYSMLDGYTDKVAIITLIFPIFFVLVTALVVLTTMTRMIEEERAEIACLSSLGYNDGKIIGKYLFIGTFCTLIAATVGMSIGLFLLINVIYPAFETLFFCPPMSKLIDPTSGFIAFLLMLFTTLIVTFVVARNELKVEPASLLKPKAPKVGKSIFIEKTQLWKKLSFNRKSTIRNILRYKKHLIMTVISVAGSTALIFAGFGLFNVADNRAVGSFQGMASTLKPIAGVIIIFALLLCMFVVYNLTNMNIGERKRELATLKVLGYHEKEIVTYIYREVFIMAAIGILVGIPLGCGFTEFILSYIDLGSIKDVMWYSYFLSAGMVVVFILVVDLMLMPKILKIDMITSLKSVE